MANVIVIGAGISGAAAAYELASDGIDVVLLDRYGPAAMASGWTLAGVRQSGRHPAELPLAREAVTMWADLADRLGGETHYRRGGNLRCARTADEAPIIERLVGEQTAAGLDLSLLRGREVQEVAPAVSPDVVCASFCPSDGHADPKATVAAFVAAAERAGAVLRFGERALAIETRDDRVTGVRTDRETIPAARVILAAGVFGNELLNPLALNVPLNVKIVAVLNSVPLPPLLEQVIGVANADCAGRQEVNGRFRVTNSSQPWNGRMVDGPMPVVRPRAGDLVAAIENFSRVVPALRTAEIESIWSGLIDATPDALPVLDGDVGIDGLSVAMGFSGHGFCLGPITGRIMADLAQGRTPKAPIGPFQLSRFDRWNAPSEPAALHG